MVSSKVNLSRPSRQSRRGQAEQAGAEADHHGGGFEGLKPFPVRQQPGKSDERLLGKRHQLDAHQRERRLAPLLDVAAEILDQLFAPLARVNPSAIERDRSVESMPSAEHGATREQM
jgi:hypothetical protein